MDFVDGSVFFEQILKIVLTVSLCFEYGNTTELQSRSRESGFKPPMSEAHLTIFRAVKLNRVFQ